MARVQLVIPDEEKSRFVHQARSEGVTFSAWLRAAARARLAERQQARRFGSPEDVEAFFQACDAMDGPEVEPDWSEHLRVIHESRARGAAGT